MTGIDRITNHKVNPGASPEGDVAVVVEFSVVVVVVVLVTELSILNELSD